MANPEGLDPALLTAGEGDEEAELHQLWFGEVVMKVGPELVVGDVGVPEDGAGVAEGGLLSIIEAIRILELKEVVVVGFG